MGVICAKRSCPPQRFFHFCIPAKLIEETKNSSKFGHKKKPGKIKRTEMRRDSRIQRRRPAILSYQP